MKSLVLNFLAKPLKIFRPFLEYLDKNILPFLPLRIRSAVIATITLPLLPLIIPDILLGNENSDPTLFGLACFIFVVEVTLMVCLGFWTLSIVFIVGFFAGLFYPEM